MSEEQAEVQSYGKVYKTLHWLLVINIGATLIFSFGMSDLPDSEKLIEYPNHAVSVTTIFLLMVLRTVWRLANPPPPIPIADGWQKKAAKMAHVTLYVLIFAQIGLGVLLASTTSVDFQSPQYGINYTSWNLGVGYLGTRDTFLVAQKTLLLTCFQTLVACSMPGQPSNIISSTAMMYLKRMLPLAKLNKVIEPGLTRSMNHLTNTTT